MSFELSTDRKQKGKHSFSNGHSGPESAPEGLALEHPTLPWIREPRFGSTLGNRAKAIKRLTNNLNLPGPLDLVHWGRHYGEKSSKFLQNPFEAENGVLHSKQEDGYVGYYHYVNGIDYSGGAKAVQKYVVHAIGLIEKEGAYFWLPSVDVNALGVYHDREMVVTLCAYNNLGRAEFRARFIVSVPKSRKLPVAVSVLYTIESHVLHKLHNYSNKSIHEVGFSFWDELAALALARLCLSTDDVAHQLCGTVNMPDLVDSLDHLRNTISRTVSLLHKSHLSGQRPRYGHVTTCGADFVKTSKYRNHLIDALVRVVALDSTGKLSEIAISSIQQIYGHEYDFVVCRLLKADLSKNNDLRFLQLVHENLTRHGTPLCQNALLLLEQARFLLARKSYGVATQIAAQAVQLLPLDFDAWYTLALCYILDEQYSRALETINAFPLLFAQHEFAATDVDGVYDSFALAYIERAQRNKLLDLRTFEAFFPAPTTAGKSTPEMASMAALWHDQFHHQPQLRHPVCGPFYQSPLFLATSIEVSAVDPRIIKLAGPHATKLALAAQSAGNAWLLMADFDSKLTWGRTYDLLTHLVTIVGWDRVVHIKNATFRGADREQTSDFVVDHAELAATDVKPWLQLLFLVIYEDLRVMVQMSSQDEERSALSWSMLGFIGWACKLNLKDSLSAIQTSLLDPSPAMGFDYHGTVKLLEIYNEFVLSDVCASTIDPLSSVYDGRHYSNKLIVQGTSPEMYAEFVRQLQRGHYSLENVLLSVTKLVSWNVRWYNYMPSALVTETLIKLCAKHDPLVVRLALQILMKNLVRKKEKTPASYTLRAMFAAPLQERTHHEFVESDTVMAYMARLLAWLELLADDDA